MSQKDNFIFEERNRRPPLDNVNALLSFIYTLLVHDVRSALETVGLDPAVGFLHRDRPGRPGLALDMMEEFRPFLADRLVLSLINLKQLQGLSHERNRISYDDEDTEGPYWWPIRNASRKKFYIPFSMKKFISECFFISSLS